MDALNLSPEAIDFLVQQGQITPQMADALKQSNSSANQAYSYQQPIQPSPEIVQAAREQSPQLALNEEGGGPGRTLKLPNTPTEEVTRPIGNEGATMTDVQPQIMSSLSVNPVTGVPKPNYVPNKQAAADTPATPITLPEVKITASPDKSSIPYDGVANINADEQAALDALEDKWGVDRGAFGRNFMLESGSPASKTISLKTPGGQAGMAQWTDQSLKALGVTREDVENMSFTQQLNLWDKYLKQKGFKPGDLKSADDVGMSEFAPAFAKETDMDKPVYKQEDDKPGIAPYANNKSYDINGDGVITVGEIRATRAKIMGTEASGVTGNATAQESENAPDYGIDIERGTLSAMDDIAAGQRKQAEGIDEQANLQTQLGLLKAYTLKEGARQDKAIVDYYEPQVKIILAQTQKLVNDTNDLRVQLANAKIDPNHYFTNTNTMQRIGDGISIAFGEILRARTGAENMGLKMAYKAADADIDAQKALIESKRDALTASNTLLGHLMQQGHNLQEAEHMARAGYKEIIANQIDQYNAMAEGPAAIAAAKILHGKNMEEAAKNMNTLAHNAYAAKTGRLTEEARAASNTPTQLGEGEVQGEVGSTFTDANSGKRYIAANRQEAKRVDDSMAAIKAARNQIKAFRELLSTKPELYPGGVDTWEKAKKTAIDTLATEYNKSLLTGGSSGQASERKEFANQFNTKWYNTLSGGLLGASGKDIAEKVLPQIEEQLESKRKDNLRGMLIVKRPITNKQGRVVGYVGSKADDETDDKKDEGSDIPSRPRQ